MGEEGAFFFFPNIRNRLGVRRNLNELKRQKIRAKIEPKSNKI